ncbi:hypothetical protein Z950_3988 [Sulfitobacter mediterraneus KCTC 32188]|nr:hypothetical protein Z950_3988 [Sulfitobacter mediterraneus KCTC 32188]
MFTFHHLAQKIRRKESRADHLLDPVGRCILRLSYLLEGLSSPDQSIP